MSEGHPAPGRVTLMGISRPVADLARAEAFYRDGLGFSRASDVTAGPPSAWLPDGACDRRARALRLRLGHQEIELVEYAVRGQPYPQGATSADPWFQHIAIVAPWIEAAYARVSRQPGFSPISRDGPERLPPGTGSVTAFKFRDPDGHPLELIHFPPGTGAPQWQQPGDGPLGYDHTAIVVHDLAASLAFYGDRLELRKAARSLNHGIEQADLDGLDDPVVDVVAMEPTAGATPHLELLAYRSPPPDHGRRIDVRPNDIAATKTVLAFDDLHAFLERLDRGGTRYATGRGAETTGPPSSVLLRDPDGHYLVAIQSLRVQPV